MPTVALDTRDAFVPMPQARASTPAACRALRARRVRRPRLLVPRARRAGARAVVGAGDAAASAAPPRPALVHAPNCFLPLRRPCPGVVTVHDLAFEDHRDDFSRRTGWKYRTMTRRAARSAERVICVSRFTRDDVCARYGVDPERTRVIPIAPALPVGEAPRPRPAAPYLLARRRPAPEEEPRAGWCAPGGGCAARGSSSGSSSPARLRGGRRAARGRRARTARAAGFVDDARSMRCMRGADALVHPSLYEGFGMAVRRGDGPRLRRCWPATTALPETGGDAAELLRAARRGGHRAGDPRGRWTTPPAAPRDRARRRAGRRALVGAHRGGDRRGVPGAPVSADDVPDDALDRRGADARGRARGRRRAGPDEIVVVDNASTDGTPELAGAPAPRAAR